VAFAQTAPAWTAWGFLGNGLRSSLDGGGGNTKFPRPYALAVTPAGVFGAYDSGTATDGSKIFRATAPFFITSQSVRPTGDSTAYATVEKIVYNPVDKQLYLKASTPGNWGSDTPTSWPSGTTAAVFKMNPATLSTTKIFQPSSLNAAYTYVSGLTVNTDNGDVLFSVNNGVKIASTNFQPSRNVFYYNNNSPDTATQILQTDNNQNGAQLNDALAYMGDNKFVEMDAGNGFAHLSVYGYHGTGGATDATTLERPYLSLNGNDGFGNTVTLYDAAHKTAHSLSRMKTSGAGLDRLINVDFYAKPGDAYLGESSAVTTARWHGTIPGATPGGNAGNTADWNVPSIDAAVLNPDGEVVLGFAGEQPYFVPNSEKHVWIKNQMAATDGSGGVFSSNDTQNWTDLGIPDSQLNNVDRGQIVGLAIGNLGAGNLGSEGKSYDVFATTQHRDSGLLRVSSTATGLARYWDTNGTAAGTGGASPSGNWDGVAANFNSDSAGTELGTLVAATDTGTPVVFSAGSDATGTYTVTVTGTQAAEKVIFNKGNVTLAGGKISAGRFDVWTGVSATVNSTLTGSDFYGLFKKTSGGTLTLGGANTWIGATTISAGTLRYGANNVIPGGNGKGNLTVAAGATLDLNSFSGTVNGISGAGTIDNAGGGASTLTVGGNNQSGTFTGVVRNTAGALAVVKTGTGSVALTGTNSFTGGTTVAAGKHQLKRLQENNPVSITGGTLQILDSSPTLPSHPAGDDAFASRPGSMIAIGKVDGVYEGMLDLGNNDLIIDYSGASPLAEVQDMVRSGFNSGNWQGKGITSSTAANPLANGNYTLGVAENALLVNPFGDGGASGPLFDGQAVDSTTVLVKFTHRVDLDLDGLVTGNDAAIFNGAFSEGDSGATWMAGDLNYNGVWDSDDAAIFNSFYDESLAHLPEPGSATGVLSAGLLLASSRRRRSAGCEAA
jgi:autotransporter-associated beta strand protein